MIRSFRQDDLEAIVDIANRAYRPIYENLRKNSGDELFELLFPDEKTFKGRQVEIFCRENPEWVFVCEEEGRIVGFVTFVLERKTGIGVLGDNAVDPQCDLKGIGQQMYRAVLDFFEKNGMRYARVRTTADNVPARKAYERAGFNIQREEVVYYRKLHPTGSK